MLHRLRLLELVSGAPASWEDMPSVADLQQQIAMAVLSDSVITKTRVGFYNPPKRIRKVAISDAAWDKITQMWNGHRKAGAASTPVIPLTYFVNGFGQTPPDLWLDLVILPWLYRWQF